MEKKFFFIKQGSYLICGNKALSKGKDIIEMSFFDLANNSELLRILRLVYLRLDTYKENAEWFTGYVASFNESELTERKEFLQTNPQIKILIEDELILEQIKKIQL